jgi:hypothetical protein
MKALNFRTSSSSRDSRAWSSRRGSFRHRKAAVPYSMKPENGHSPAGMVESCRRRIAPKFQCIQARGGQAARLEMRFYWIHYSNADE